MEPAPATFAAARKLVGRAVVKEFAQGIFNGIVKRVDANVAETEGSAPKWPFLFYVVYDDDDFEHLTWEEVQPILQPAPEAQQRPRPPKPSKSARAATADASQQQAQQRRGSKRAQQEQGENGAVKAAVSPAEAAASPRSAKRRRKQAAPQHFQDDKENDSAADSEPGEDDGDEAMADAAGKAAKRSQGGERRRKRAEQEEEEDEQEEEEEQQDEGDGGDDDDEEEEEQEEEEDDNPHDEFAPTQHDSSRVFVRRKGHAGHLHSIKLQNFMCHENFEMSFGTHVNFVSGTNGSGKSAVLQGLQCCLGATAKNTGRASSLEGFIRTGADEAKVQVTLWNTGEDAHMPSLLGETVTIERRITRRGGTAWKVYDQRMKPLPAVANRNSINAMLDHFSINASNPLAVMTQDTARNFLGGGTADKRKFDLFMEATMLSDFKARLSMATVHVNQMKAGITAIKEEYYERRALLKQLTEKLQKLRDADQLLSQRTNLERAVLWTGVEERAGVLACVQEKLDVSVPKRRAPYEQELARLERALELLREEEKQKIARQLEINRANQEFAAETHRLAEAYKAARKALQAAKRKQQEQAREVTEAKDRLESMVQAQIESNDDSKRELAQRLAQNQSQVAQETQRREKLAQEVAARQDELAEAQQRVQELLTQKPKLDNKLDSLRRTISNLNEEKRGIHAALKDRVQAFGGQGISQLVAGVRSNIQKFHRPPLGPIGAHLALDDAKWAFAVEHALQAHLNKWIVHDQHDEKELRALARLHRCNLTVLIYSYDTPRYVVPAHKRPASEYTLLQDVVRLKVDQPELEHVLWNQLLDRASAANVVLAEDERSAGDVAYQLVANVSASFSIAGTKYQAVGMQKGTKKTTQFSGRPRLGADVRAILAELDRLLAEAEGNVGTTQQELAAIDAELRAARATVDRLMNVMRGKARDKGMVEASLRQLQTQAQDMAAEQAEGEGEDVAGMIAGMQQELTSSQMQLDQLEGELQEAAQAEASARSLHQQKAAEIALASEEISTVNEAVVRIAEEKGGAEAAAKTMSDSLARLAAEEAQLQQRKEATVAELARCRADAEGVCSEEEGREAIEAVRALTAERVAAQLEKQLERQRRAGAAREFTEAQRQGAVDAEVSKRMSPEELHKELERIEKAIRSAEGEAGGSKEDLELEHGKVQAEVNSRGAVYQNLKATFSRLAQFLKHRDEAYYQLFQNVARGVSEKFFKYMARRNHRGRVKIDEETSELKLLVMINGAAAGNQKAAVKDLKQLSGGERSFTTVAFILALGEWTESPFRAMDEFDVFMDAINRRTATETLLQFAIDNDNLQFVFLTPQDLQAVEDAKQYLAAKLEKDIPSAFVKVVQMRPARANATRAA